MLRPSIDLKQVYLCREFVDMRKSINGLSLLVESVLNHDSFSGNLFVFCNKKRDKLKMLYWERNGYVLWYKRLEKDRFKWPKKMTEDVIHLDGQEINWLLDGIDISQLKAHDSLPYRSVL